MATQTQLMTFAEFVEVSDPASGHLELHHGEVIHVPPRKKAYASIQQVLYDLLLPLLGSLGRLGVEFPFRPVPEYESWEGDLTFISKLRWENDQNEYFLGSPDLVVEVMSKSNTIDEMLDRQQVCFVSGCLAFWTVFPERKLILVTTPDGTTVTYDRNSHLPLLPFADSHLAVVEIFKGGE